jgi:catechol 2,3-dioxygenase-like lactoylglutathione lyase family enzyme
MRDSLAIEHLPREIRYVMNLAKQFLDVGIFTNNIDAMRVFYAERVRLPFEEILPVAPGMKQHRFGMLGSVLKLNASRDTVPPRVAGGYRRLIIADPNTTSPTPLQDPDGNDIELVPVGERGIRQIEIQLGVIDEASFEHFFGDAMQGRKLGPGRFQIGDTIVSFVKDAAATRAPKIASASPMDVITAMRAVGIRYITAQVRSCDDEHKRLLSMGAQEAAAPVTLGESARISFVRDPDGNFIEISQRASLTGPLPR